MTKTQKILIVSILLSLVALSGYVFLFKQIRNINQEIATVENEIEFAAKKDNRLRSFKAILQDTEEERVTLDRYFVESESIVDFIKVIESLERETGVQLDTQSVSVSGGEDDKAHFELLELKLEAEGAWHEVYHFLSLVEALPYAILVKQVTVEKPTISRTTVVTTEEKKEVPLPWKLSLSISVVKLK